MIKNTPITVTALTEEEEYKVELLDGCFCESCGGNQQSQIEAYISTETATWWEYDRVTKTSENTNIPANGYMGIYFVNN